MYRMLQRNLKGYFSIHEIEAEKYRYQVAKILEGLINIKMYDQWKLEAPKKYAEISNLVYQVKKYSEKFPRFETLNWDLWAIGYDAIEDSKFCGDDLFEQLKIINLCLGGAYLV